MTLGIILFLIVLHDRVGLLGLFWPFDAAADKVILSYVVFEAQLLFLVVAKLWFLIAVQM